MGADDGGIGSEKLLAAREDHGCFGCGGLNPLGLRLRFRRLGDNSGVWAAYTPRVEDEGYGGMVHGGIVTTLLDEAMAWAIAAGGVWAVTAKIGVRFRRPAESGVALRTSGRVVADRGRMIETAGELRRAGDGLLLAEATATFARVEEEQAAAWRERYLGDG